MMAWIIALGMALLVLGFLYLSGRCSRMALEISGALLMVGLAGYAWQGSPEMSGHPVTARPAP